MPPPDPSQPDRFRETIRQEIQAYLSDPLGLPDPFVSWLTTTISVYANTSAAPIDTVKTPPTT